jgi:hypothetical protein
VQTLDSRFLLKQSAEGFLVDEGRPSVIVQRGLFDDHVFRSDAKCLDHETCGCRPGVLLLSRDQSAIADGVCLEPA